MTKLGFSTLLFILAILITLSYLFLKPYIPKIKLITPTKQVKHVTRKLPAIYGTSTLGKAVAGALADSQGNYAIAIKNLRTGESFFQNDKEQFSSASLYKLWIMAVAFKQIEDGTLKDDEVLSGNVVDLNNEFNISSDSADLTEGTVTLTVHDALEQMITISHNYAALLLSQRIGLGNVNQFLTDHHYNSSTVNAPPQTSASDIEAFYEDLYHGNLGNENSTMAMLSTLKRQTINQKLPLKLPDDVVIAHKTGELDSLSHDAGIVFSPKGDYVIVVLSESDDPTGADGRIADLSLAVYNYFQNKN